MVAVWMTVFKHKIESDGSLPARRLLGVTQRGQRAAVTKILAFAGPVLPNPNC